jgi:hypothetical protein
MQSTLVRVTTPMPNGEPLVWHCNCLTADQQEALGWIRSHSHVVPGAVVEVVPGF